MSEDSEQGGCTVYFDGDDVGSRIELHLLRGEVDEAAAISAAVVRGVGDLANELSKRFDARIVFAAGDEVLAVLPRAPGTDEIERLRATFRQDTDLSISCGVGFSAHEAVVSLRMAKLLGKDRSQSLYTS